MRLAAESTTEPFAGGGDTPAHATGTLRVVEDAGPRCDSGPSGTSTTGRGDTLLPVLERVPATALTPGATGSSLQVQHVDG
ncbi:hypothetical protein [Modestobacter sp. I12A-02662]|uniref:hypothetical protein n=1 Tax=Modestobacter sp. I12A-02662 TaxID=1730496 RepID=UPI0034DEB20E